MAMKLRTPKPLLCLEGLRTSICEVNEQQPVVHGLENDVLVFY